MTPFCQIISFSYCTLWGVKTELQGNEAVWEHKTNMQIKLVVFYVHVYIYIYILYMYICMYLSTCVWKTCNYHFVISLRNFSFIFFFLNFTGFWFLFINICSFKSMYRNTDKILLTSSWKSFTCNIIIIIHVLIFHLFLICIKSIHRDFVRHKP